MRCSDRARALALALLLAVGGSASAVAQPVDSRPGIGRSNADPVGVAFDWPPGLVLQAQAPGTGRR